PRVARRCIEDDLVWRQCPGRFAVGDHPGRRAVLHGPAGVAPLRLRVELDVPQPGLEAGEAHKRRITDEIDHGSDRTGRPWGYDWHVRLRQSEIISNSQIPSPKTQIPTAFSRVAGVGIWALGFGILGFS